MPYDRYLVRIWRPEPINFAAEVAKLLPQGAPVSSEPKVCVVCKETPPKPREQQPTPFRAFEKLYHDFSTLKLRKKERQDPIFMKAYTKLCDELRQELYHFQYHTHTDDEIIELYTYYDDYIPQFLTEFGGDL